MVQLWIKNLRIVTSNSDLLDRQEAFIRRLAEAGNSKANGMRRLTVTYHDIGALCIISSLSYTSTDMLS